MLECVFQNKKNVHYLSENDLVRKRFKMIFGAPFIQRCYNTKAEIALHIIFLKNRLRCNLIICVRG